MNAEPVTMSRPTPLTALFWLTFLASISTGVLWSGISFIAKHDYDYSPTANFLLYFVTAVVYIIVAFSSGRITRGLERFLSPRGIMTLILLGQVILSPLPVVFAGSWTIWVTAAATSVAGALLWPIVESYLAAGRHGREMRSAMGWWNISWTGAVAVALVGMAPLIGQEDATLARYALVALSPISVLAMLALPWFARTPGAHDEITWQQSITVEYPYLLRSVRILLPLGYVLIGTISPLLPYRFEAIEVAASFETPAAATWTIVRVAAIAIMWRITFWHGRWGTLLFGGGGMLLGFVMVVLSPTIEWIIIGLAVFGAGQGVVYYAALYYAMSVGRAEVDAGGVHESLIGFGYAIGPLAALVGERIRLPGVDPAGGGGIVTVVMSVIGISLVPAVTPYLQARRMRASSGEAEHE